MKQDSQNLLDQAASKIRRARLQVIFLALRHRLPSNKPDLEIAALAIGFHQDFLDDGRLPEEVQDYCLDVLAERVIPPDLPELMRTKPKACITNG